MAEVNFPSNRQYSNGPNQNQNEKQRLDPVITADAIISTKKPVAQRFKEAFFGENGIDIIDDVVIPGLQNLVLDVLEMKFFHQVGRRGPGYYNGGYQNGPGYTNYSQAYYGGSSYYGTNYNGGYQQSNQNGYQQNNRIDYKNIILRTRQDAESVVFQMRKRCEEQRSISIAEFFDLLQLPGDYTDNNWGWTNPNAIGIRRVSSGFLIVVPDAQPLVIM